MLDGSHRTYVTGSTSSQDFPVTIGAFDRDFNGGNLDGFVARFTTDGSALDYATFLGGSGDDFLSDLSVDNLGRAFVTGVTDSTDFPTSTGAFDTTHNGATDVIVARLSTSGSILGYSTFLGGNSTDGNYDPGISVDDTGRFRVTGCTWSPNFPTTPGAFDTSMDNPDDAFVTQFDATGSLQYSTFLGGNSNDHASAIAVDGSEGVYVTGWTLSHNFPATAGAFDTTYNLGEDAFVAKLNLDPDFSGRSLFLPWIVK